MFSVRLAGPHRHAAPSVLPSNTAPERFRGDLGNSFQSATPLIIDPPIFTLSSAILKPTPSIAECFELSAAIFGTTLHLAIAAKYDQRPRDWMDCLHCMDNRRVINSSRQGVWFA